MITQNPYEDIKILDQQFGTPKLLTVRELKSIKALDEQREKNQEKMRQKIQDSGGFSGKMVRPILISDTVGQDNIGDYKITDGQHTVDVIANSLSDDIKVPVVVYRHTPVEAARAFASWNKEGVQLLSNEQVFPAQVTYQDPDAIRTLNVLTKTGRKFSTIKSTHNYGVGALANNNRTIRRGKLEEAIKINRAACELALDLQAEFWPSDNKPVEDMVLLTLGWTYLFNQCPELTQEPEPFNTFKQWIRDEIAAQRPKQDAWIYSGERRAQKEKLDIARFTLRDFLITEEDQQDQEWYQKLKSILLRMDIR